jgi:hypothetical protein
MKRLFIYNIIALLLILPVNIFAAGEFLDIGIGARAAGMGRTGVALSDDFTAAYWNPAGLGFIDRLIIGYHLNQHMDDFYNNYLSTVFFIPGIGTFGVSSTLFSMANNDMTLTTMDQDGLLIDSQNTFSMFDMNLMTSYGRKLTENISVGGNLKYIYSKIEDVRAYAFALDGGFLMKPVFFDFINVGLTVMNLGSSLKYMEVKESLPMTLKMGYCVNLLYLGVYQFNILNDYIIGLNNYIVGLNNDFIGLNNYNDLGINFGLEYVYQNYIALRVGYEYSGVFSQFNIGGGFHFVLLNKDFYLNISYSIPRYDFNNYFGFDVSAGF